MASEQNGAPEETGTELDAMTENMHKIEELSQRLVAALTKKSAPNPALEGPGQDLYLKTGTALWAQMMTDPSKLIETQVQYWGKTLNHFVEAQKALSHGEFEAPEDNTPNDPRFKNPLWNSNPYFNFIKQQYFLNAEAMQKAIDDIEGVDGKDRQRLKYFTDQIVNLMSPTNFLGTNPDALERAVETEGASLVKGLENLVHDIERNEGDLLVSLADENAFKLGENIATTEGQVVFRNRMLELIQFSPKTETVHKTPIVMFPPWINKYYVLDLKPQNSLINWIVEQGFTLFVVSWVNPDHDFADVGLDTYIEEAYLTSVEVAKEITGEDQVNAIGYCVAGTALSLTLALLNKRKDKSIKSATFFTTLTDFSDQGEFGVFLQDDFVEGIERQVEQDGVLRSYYMSRTFSYLRSNDLIYTPAIKSYMMGEAPPAFDLLYWNGDSTNLPGRMTIEYLRGLCQRNEFVEGGFELLGETVKNTDVKVPVCAIACETDHIAPWKASYEGFKKLGSRSKTFIVSQSGHIAGIVNPPSKKKYGHYTNSDLKQDSDAWMEGAEFNEGSWWPRWQEWIKKHSGKQVPARIPGDSDYPALCPAPGTYVAKKPSV